jgi:beta-glucosidase
LRVKFLLGLFEQPYASQELHTKVTHCREHQDLALQAAREGMVLLKNKDNLLPLSKNLKSIAVIGPNADNGKNQLGDYSVPPENIKDVITVLAGIKSKVSSETKITYVEGCEITDIKTKFVEAREYYDNAPLGQGHDQYNPRGLRTYVKNDEPLESRRQKIQQARAAAQNADVAIVVVGENRATSGEGCDVADLDLSGMQNELVKAVWETGTPTVVVLVNGRALSIPLIAEHVPAILEAWFCGEKGGAAVADVLFGDHNPSGRLPVSFPRFVGQLPLNYNYKSPQWDYVDMSADPLFEFGYGLSFTSFKYSNLTIAPPKTTPEGKVIIGMDLTNSGDRAGQEVVQLYIQDVVSSVATPFEELKAFRKVALQPGEKKTIKFEIASDQLSLLDRQMKRIVEPGQFKVMIGSSSKDIRLNGTFEVFAAEDK